MLKFESVIHEFDPYFNYRTTKFLAEEGFYNFLNWFDDRVWYPLGRIIGGIKHFHYQLVNFFIIIPLSISIKIDFRYNLSRFDGDISSFLSLSTDVEHYYRYKECLCLPGATVF